MQTSPPSVGLSLPTFNVNHQSHGSPCSQILAQHKRGSSVAPFLSSTEDRFCPLPTPKKWSWDAGYVSQWIRTKVCRRSSQKSPQPCHILSSPLPSGLPSPLSLLISGVVLPNKTTVLKTQLPVWLPVETRWSGPTERVLPDDSMLHSCDQGPRVLTRVTRPAVTSSEKRWPEWTTRIL